MHEPRHLLALLLVLGCAFPTAAQGLMAIARNTNDSVVIRWSPTNIRTWEGIRRYGVKVERLTIQQGMTGKPTADRISPDTIKVWSMERFRANFPKDHAYAPAVVQALYGKTFAAPPGQPDLRNAMDRANDQQLRWTFCMLFADIDAGSANAMGLRWVDRDLSVDALYLYRVIALDPLQRDTALIGVNRKNGPDAIAAVPQPVAEELDGAVRLQWDAGRTGEQFSAYWIERSGAGKPWSRVHARPFIESMGVAPGPLEVVHYTDTTLTANYVPYQYRVVGVTPFGEESPPSSTIAAMGRDRTAPSAPVLKEVKDVRGKLVVYWDQPSAAADLKGFRVEKSPEPQVGFLPLHEGLLPTTARSFTDTSTFLIGENHFRVVALDTANNASFSLTGYGSLIDSIAPSTPTALTGSIDTLGVVRLHWKVGPEQDLLGYRVFFANATDHEFTNRTGVPVGDTTFTDTIPLNTLTKRIHYRIAAVDRNFNHSDLGPILTLLKPDIVPPTAPVFAGQQVSDTTVTLRFVPSSSEDLAHHRLLRKLQGDTIWTELFIWPASDVRREITDGTVNGPAYFSYSIIAVDSAGNSTSAPGTADVRVHKHLRKAGPSGLRGFHDPLSKMVQLNWSAPSAQVKHYIIYRSKDGGNLVSLASVEGSRTGFEDMRLTGVGRYDYQLQAVYSDGGVSAMVPCANPIEVR
ncbi:MAG TPA: hypothetical protein PLB89_02390 [Flavobacteriales bacterium]|nr:hypothetical protein [Flavobacteriales bacterium]